MDSSDSSTPQKSEPSPAINFSAHHCNVLQSSWIRRTFCFGDEMDWFFSNNGPHFLLRINPLFLFVLHLIEKRKA
jgi:hypothetical protein